MTSFAIRAELSWEKTVHDVFAHFGIPTIPEYEVEEYIVSINEAPVTYLRARMTDLSEGGTNLVFSVPDADRVEDSWPTEGNRVWISSTRDRSVYNSETFFNQLEQIITRGQEAQGNVNGTQVNGIKINFPAGFFLVAKPNGTIQTYIGDYRDAGVLNARELDSDSYNPNKPQYYKNVEIYLTFGVLRFFPQLTEQARQFINKISGGIYPVELIGETDSTKRQNSYDSHGMR